MLHQWAFYRTYPYDNTIFDNDFSRILLLYTSTPLMYRSGAIFVKINYFLRETFFFDKTYRCFFTNAHPIHAIFMILRQREAPLILGGSGMVLTGICMFFIGFITDFPIFWKKRKFPKIARNVKMGKNPYFDLFDGSWRPGAVLDRCAIRIVPEYLISDRELDFAAVALS